MRASRSSNRWRGARRGVCRPPAARGRRARIDRVSRRWRSAAPAAAHSPRGAPPIPPARQSGSARGPARGRGGAAPADGVHGARRRAPRAADRASGPGRRTESRPCRESSGTGSPWRDRRRPRCRACPRRRSPTSGTRARRRGGCPRDAPRRGSNGGSIIEPSFDSTPRRAVIVKKSRRSSGKPRSCRRGIL